MLAVAILGGMIGREERVRARPLDRGGGGEGEEEEEACVLVPLSSLFFFHLLREVKIIFRNIFFKISTSKSLHSVSKKTNAFSFSTRSYASRLLLLLLLLRSSEARLPSHASAMARRARDVDVD